MSHLINLTFEKFVDCSSSVAKWNYWDHEHLDIVHSGYTQSDILYEKKNFLFRVDKISLPFIPFFRFKTPIFMVQHNDETTFTYAIQMGVVSKTTITIVEIEKNRSKITMNYKFYLEGVQILLKPILYFLIPRWNKRVWEEDLPLKLRRQKVLNYNHKDFIGLPEGIEERFRGEVPELVLPIKRPLNSSRDKHPLK